MDDSQRDEIIRTYRADRLAASRKRKSRAEILGDVMVTTVIGLVTWLLSGGAWGNFWIPLLASIAALIVMEFWVWPFRHYIWTVPEASHLASHEKITALTSERDDARVALADAHRAHEMRSVAKFSFVFDPENIPYLQHFPYTDTSGVTGEIRMYRVGIKNDSDETIKDARVLFESFAFLMDGMECPPSTNHPAPVEHALNVMGLDTKDGTFDLRPGDRPTAHIDLVQQWISSQGKPSKWFSPCYATGYRAPFHLTTPSWLISVRAEGGGRVARQTFFISEDTDGKVVVSLYPESR